MHAGLLVRPLPPDPRRRLLRNQFLGGCPVHVTVSITNGDAAFDLVSGWNTVKNVSLVSDRAETILLDGFVHFDADFSWVTTGEKELTVIGGKRGNYLGSDVQDKVTIGLMDNLDG